MVYAGAIKGFLAWLSPLWNLLAILLVRLLVVIFFILLPLLVWLQERIQGLDLRPFLDAFSALRQALEPLQQQDVSKGPVLPAWVGTVLRDLGILLVSLARARLHLAVPGKDPQAAHT